MNRVTFLGACVALALAAQPGHAQEPFYKGKRLTILVNFAPGGSTDAEARVFARHIGRLIDGQPSLIIQNMEGAAGLVGAAKLAIERGEINFYGESSPSYFSIIEPGLVKSGTVIPVYYDSVYDGQNFIVPDAAKGAPVSAFHEFYQAMKGTMPSGQLWEAYKSLVAVDGNILRLIVMPPGTPPAAVTALREALIRLDSDKGYAEDSRKAFGYVTVWLASADNNTTAMRSMTFYPATRSFLQDYIKNPPK
jgi:hypothetical protein